MSKPRIVQLSGSPEARARMARWLEKRLGYEEGALDDGPVGDLPDHPLLQLMAERYPPGTEVKLEYHPEPRGVWTDPPDDED